MPYEAIDEKEYNKQVNKLGKLSFGVIKHEEAEIDKLFNSSIYIRRLEYFHG